MKTTFLSIIIVVLGCTSKNRDTTDIDLIDTSLVNHSSVPAINDSIASSSISSSLLKIAQILDSCGFIFDTTRYYKNYGRFHNSKPMLLLGYYFYDVEIQNTIPYRYFLRCDTSQSPYTIEWCKQNQINIIPFRNAISITQYFYITKSYHDMNYKGDKYFPDGIVEEWNFPDSSTAREASMELSNHEAEVYVNCAGFICFVDNYMYVFHSRAINFMYTIRPYFKLITRELNAAQANKSLLGV